MKTIINNKYFLLGIILIIGMVLGWIIKPSKNNTVQQTNHQLATPSDHQTIKSPDHQIWTCSMHPQIRQDHPGKCPICGMDLIPLNSEENEEASGSDEIKIVEASMKLAQVEITRVERKMPVKEVYMPGKIKADERRISVITSRFPGGLKNFLSISPVRMCEKVSVWLIIYSPELVTAQKEFLKQKNMKQLILLFTRRPSIN